MSAGESFDNPKLTEIADRNFRGSRAKGTYTPRDAYDALETAVNMLLLEGRARELMQMSAEVALTNHLRPLTRQLPRQTDRTNEQIEFQQFSTPPALAYLAARVLNPQATDIVLEPSAGTASLAIWPRSIGARVICNEINPRRRALLIEELGFETFGVDAEILDDLLTRRGSADSYLDESTFQRDGRQSRTASLIVRSAAHRNRAPQATRRREISFNRRRGNELSSFELYRMVAAHSP